VTDAGSERRKCKRFSKQYRMELSVVTFPLTRMRSFEVTGIDISTGGLNQTQFQTHSFRTGYHCSILFSPRRARRNAKGEESGID